MARSQSAGHASSSWEADRVSNPLPPSKIDVPTHFQPSIFDPSNPVPPPSNPVPSTPPYPPWVGSAHLGRPTCLEVASEQTVSKPLFVCVANQSLRKARVLAARETNRSSTDCPMRLNALVCNHKAASVCQSQTLSGNVVATERRPLSLESCRKIIWTP